MDFFKKRYFKVIGSCLLVPKEDDIIDFISYLFKWTDINYDPDTDEVKFIPDPSKKKSILQHSSAYINQLRENALKSGFIYSNIPPIESKYDQKNNEIILNEGEVKFLNEIYFNEKISEVFDNANKELNDFYLDFCIIKKYELLDRLKEIYDILVLKEFPRYPNESKIDDTDLTISIFKDIVSNKWSLFIINLTDKIRLIDPTYMEIIIPQNNLTKQGSDSELGKYIKPECIQSFLDYEKKLKDNKFINDHNKWMKPTKKSLIRFFLYCKSQDIFTNYHQDINNNKFLRDFLEKRYDFDTKDQGKPSKYKMINDYKGIFFFL